MVTIFDELWPFQSVVLILAFISFSYRLIRRLTIRKLSKSFIFLFQPSRRGQGCGSRWLHWVRRAASSRARQRARPESRSGCRYCRRLYNPVSYSGFESSSSLSMPFFLFNNSPSLAFIGDTTGFPVLASSSIRALRAISPPWRATSMWSPNVLGS